MRAVVLGTTPFTLACARAAQARGFLAGVMSMPSHCTPLNSVDLRSFSAAQDVPYAEFEDINGPEALAWLTALTPDWLISSWPRILNQACLSIPQYGVIGSHPTALPHNRGRHPLHWTLALGMEHSALSFFRMDAGMDSGPLLAHAPFSVARDEDIASLTDKVNATAEAALGTLLDQLSANPHIPGTPQDETQASIWRKRSPHDGLLDWRMSVSALVRAVRAYSPPFPCARLAWREGLLPVAAAHASAHPAPPRLTEMEPGRILFHEDKALHIKADDGLIRVALSVPVPRALAAEPYLHPPTYYLLQNPGFAADLDSPPAATSPSAGI